MVEAAADRVLRRGLRSSAAYSLIAITQRAVPFLLLPIYASALAPAEYGLVAVVTTLGGLLSSLLGFGLEAYVIRTSINLGGEGSAHRRFVNSIGVFAITASLLAAGAIAISIAVIGRSVFGAPPSLVALSVLFAGLQAPSAVFVGPLLRAQERLRAYASFGAAQTISTALFTLIAVVLLRAGPIGWVAASVAASAVTLLAGLAFLGHRLTGEVDWRVVRAALVFGLPLLPHSLSHWALGLSDRLVLASVTDAAQVGVYNLAYQLAAPIGLIVVSVNQGLLPLYAAAGRRRGLGASLAQIASYQVHLGLFLGVAVASVGPAFVALAFPDEYADAAGLVGWIAAGYVLFGAYLISANIVSMTIGETRWLWIATAFAALANIGLNLATVPKWGATAAAANTAVAYAVLLAGATLYRNAVGDAGVHIAWRRVGVGGGVLVGGGIVGVLASPTGDDLASLLVRVVCVLLALFVVAGLHVGVWRTHLGVAADQPPVPTEPNE
jgi:O-antigen/teichoic acid export membrane protein